MKKSVSPSACLLLFFLGTAVADNDIVFKNGFEPSPCGGLGNCCQGAVLYSEGFADGNQPTWGGQWSTVGNAVDLADIVNGQARLRPVASNYSLARMYRPGQFRDIELTFTLYFEDAMSQGIGFYVRSNGGYLQQTVPPGEGYAVFIERFFMGPTFGLWYEHDGIEEAFVRDADPAYGLLNETAYRVRFQVFQQDAQNTRLRARIWPATEVEPEAWDVSILDAYPPLQNVSGGLAIDSWSTQTNGQIAPSTRVDDIEITQLCNPLLRMSALSVLESGLQFAEGPVWRGDHLLFSDIDASQIYRWDEGIGLTVFSPNSGASNGLIEDNNGNLLAAEHQNRRISLTDAAGTITSVVDNYNGDRFNSPNDIAVSSGNIVYFTDPDFGLGGRPRELPYNGIFRWHPTLGVFPEYQGDINSSRPNGIVLSTDENTIYWSDTTANRVYRQDVGAEGALSNLRLFVDNIIIPDGMCVDAQGNIFIATWNNAIEVYSPEGNYWGALANNVEVTNCTFDDQFQQLFATSRSSLYRSQISP